MEAPAKDYGITDFFCHQFIAMAATSQGNIQVLHGTYQWFQRFHADVGNQQYKIRI